MRLGAKRMVSRKGTPLNGQRLVEAFADGIWDFVRRNKPIHQLERGRWNWATVHADVTVAKNWTAVLQQVGLVGKEQELGRLQFREVMWVLSWAKIYKYYRLLRLVIMKHGGEGARRRVRLSPPAVGR